MGIGLKSTQMHIWKNHILRNKTAGEHTYLKLSVARIDYVVLGQQFYDWIKMERRLRSSPQEKGQNKEIRASRSVIEEYKGTSLEKEDKEDGNFDLKEDDKFLKGQYNMGYYYDQKREEESALRAKLDYFSDEIKKGYGIKGSMEERYSQFTENEIHKDEEATESYQAFNLALSDYNEEENMEINDYYFFNQKIPEKEVNWEELIFGKNLEEKEEWVTRASSPALKEDLCEEMTIKNPLNNKNKVNENILSDVEILRQITEFLKETTNKDQEEIPQIPQVTEFPICSNNKKLQKRKFKHKKQNNTSKLIKDIKMNIHFSFEMNHKKHKRISFKKRSFREEIFSLINNFFFIYKKRIQNNINKQKKERFKGQRKGKSFQEA
ncbi:hypothetical protein O181_101471 [Austropuccinia psidii MF-1]|uniref:Uncharacterized protein n=1 Tax=Austropuccinia psidii MF-1 TaxID=1389203 RepID=A0A9Q3PIP1_9BASI|nr:hypothetical protein [Austropuccinia psidii MF-1]